MRIESIDTLNVCFTMVNLGWWASVIQLGKAWKYIVSTHQAQRLKYHCNSLGMAQIFCTDLMPNQCVAQGWRITRRNPGV